MTVQLELREIVVQDPSRPPHPYDLWPELADYSPEDPEHVWGYLELQIGLAGEEGADTFAGRFATARAMTEEKAKITEPHWSLPDHVIIIDRFDRDAFAAKMRELVKSCEDKTWYHSVRNLMKYFQWEFAGMHISKEGDFDADGNVTPQGRARQNEIEPLPWERADWVE